MFNFKENALVETIRTNVTAAQNLDELYSKVDAAVAGAVRAALEGAVKLFYIHKYGSCPDYPDRFLYNAMRDTRFSSNFSQFVMSDMHVIRIYCNEILHIDEEKKGEQLPSDITGEELVSRLNSCIKYIENRLGIKILPKSLPKPAPQHTTAPPPAPTPAPAPKAGVIERNTWKALGTSAIAAYDYCCNKVGFLRSKRGLFGRQRPLYAQNATRENYSIWFICHNQYTGTSNGRWNNIIHDDSIEEEWLKEKPEPDPVVRVTFARFPSAGGYVFLGVFRSDGTVEYKRLSTGKSGYVRIYKKISDVYPLQ